MRARVWLWIAAGAATTIALAVRLPKPVVRPRFTAPIEPRAGPDQVRRQARLHDLSTAPSMLQGDPGWRPSEWSVHMALTIGHPPPLSQTLQQMVELAAKGRGNVRWQLRLPDDFMPLPANASEKTPAAVHQRELMTRLLTQRSNTAWLSLCAHLQDSVHLTTFLARDEEPAALTVIVTPRVKVASVYLPVAPPDSSLAEALAKQPTPVSYEISWDVSADVGGKAQAHGSILQKPAGHLSANTFATPDDVLTTQVLQTGDGPDVLIERWLELEPAPRRKP